MSDFQRLSESEMEIMKIVWKSETSITSDQLIKVFEESKGWKAQTISTFLSRLVEKGVLSSERKGKKNYYTPKITLDQYKQMETKMFIEDVHGGSVKSFFAALCSSDGLDVNEIEELKKWLSER